MGTITFQDGSVTIRYDRLINDLTAEDTLLIQAVAEILGYFHYSFAAPMPLSDFYFLRHPYEGNSYAFPGGFIFREKGYKSEPSFHRYLAHEVSHSWWNNGSNTDFNRWLNESFAEYSGHLYVREKFGQNEYEELIQQRLKDSYDAGPIYQTEKFYDYSIMYDKGTYRLYQLHKKLGDEIFHAFLEKILIDKIDSTQGILDVIEALKDKQTNEWFLSKLKL